jgi:hypothetical protein
VTARIILVALAAVVLGTGAWFTFGPGAAPPVVSCSAAAELPIASGSPDLITDMPLVRWSVTELPDEIDDADEQIMLDVVSFAGGFVAVGRESDGPDWHAFVLRSADGLRWDRVAGDERRFAGTEIGTLAVVGARLFGIGSVSTDDRGGSRGAVWFTDDRRAWREATGAFDETSPRVLAAGDDGLLLLGATNDDGRPTAWTSPNGETWKTQPLELPVPDRNAQFGALAALDDGWLAVGSISAGADAPAAPVVWRSGDGRSWSCHRLDAAGFEVARPFELHRSGIAWLALGDVGDVCGFGASCPGFPIAWASDGGLAWSDAVGDIEPIEVGGIAYAGNERGFVAVGHGATWISPDGRRSAAAAAGVRRCA